MIVLTQGEEPLTNGIDGREDIAVLQRILAAASPEGLGGEAAMKIGLFTDGLLHLPFEEALETSARTGS